MAAPHKDVFTESTIVMLWVHQRFQAYLRQALRGTSGLNVSMQVSIREFLIPVLSRLTAT